jgi:hypothetical protein
MAAPYFSPKLIAMQGVAGAPPVSLDVLRTMPQKDLDKLETALNLAEGLLEKHGAESR